MQQRPARHHRVVSSLATLAMLVSVMFVGIPASHAVNIAQNKIVNPNPANWTPNVLNGQVNSIVQIGNKIYAGGQFTQVQAASGGTIFSRSNLFSFDATTGAIDTNFAPTFDDTVKALAVAPDGNLFVGGYFNAVNGDTTVRKLVKLNPTTDCGSPRSARTRTARSGTSRSPAPVCSSAAGSPRSRTSPATGSPP